MLTEQERVDIAESDALSLRHDLKKLRDFASLAPFRGRADKTDAEVIIEEIDKILDRNPLDRLTKTTSATQSSQEVADLPSEEYMHDQVCDIIDHDRKPMLDKVNEVVDFFRPYLRSQQQPVMKREEELSDYLFETPTPHNCALPDRPACRAMAKHILSSGLIKPVPTREQIAAAIDQADDVWMKDTTSMKTRNDYHVEAVASLFGLREGQR